MKEIIRRPQRKRPIENSLESRLFDASNNGRIVAQSDNHVERFARKSKPIYEDIRWRFIINLVLLALVTLMLSEIFIYDELAKSLTPDNLEMAELTLSTFVLFDLLLIIRYVPDRIEFLKKNWMKALLILPSWIIMKPFAILGLDHLSTLFSEHSILQLSRSYNFFDNVKDFIEKL